MSPTQLRFEAGEYVKGGGYNAMTAVNMDEHKCQKLALDADTKISNTDLCPRNRQPLFIDFCTRMAGQEAPFLSSLIWAPLLIDFLMDL